MSVSPRGSCFRPTTLHVNGRTPPVFGIRALYKAPTLAGASGPLVIASLAAKGDRNSERRHDIVLEIVPAAEIAIVEIVFDIEAESDPVIVASAEAEARGHPAYTADGNAISAMRSSDSARIDRHSGQAIAPRT